MNFENFTDLPPKVIKNLKLAYPDLDDEAYQTIFNGLKQFFTLCKENKGKTILMPSESVDLIWHELILHTKYYHEFCNEFFGYYLHHTPTEENNENKEKSEDQLLALWLLCCQNENLNPAAYNSLPCLFKADVLTGRFHETYVFFYVDKVNDFFNSQNKFDNKNNILSLLLKAKEKFNIQPSKNKSVNNTDSYNSNDLNPFLLMTMMNPTPTKASSDMTVADTYVNPALNHGGKHGGDVSHDNGSSNNSNNNHHNCSTTTNNHTNSCGGSSCGGGCSS